MCIANFSLFLKEAINKTFSLFSSTQVYLVVQDNSPKGSYRFIRKRSMVGRDGRAKGTVYQLTEAQKPENANGNGEMIEVKRIITAREYWAAYKSRDLTRHIVRQERICFLYERQSFTVHCFITPADGLCILHAQVVESSQEEGNETTPVFVQLPSFLDVERQLGGEEDEKMYGSYALSVIGEKNDDATTTR